MPIVDIRLAGNTTRGNGAALVADITQSLVQRLGKLAAAVRAAIAILSTENHGVRGHPIAGRASSLQPREDANAAVSPQ